MASGCKISGADEQIFVKFGSGVLFKFTDNRRNCERTFYCKTAHFSLCIFYINTSWVKITGKQRSGQFRVVIISVAVFGKKLSSLCEMSARCHTRSLSGLHLHHTSNIPLLLPTDNSCVVCVGVVVKGNVHVCD